MRLLLRSFLLALLVAAPTLAVAQPVDGEECPPETDTAGTLVEDIRAIEPPVPTAREYAEKVMARILDDRDNGKDRWGYTSDTGDGCYARSYATNYDMATGIFGELPAGFTNKTIYIYWKNHSWRYHTAAVISGPDGDFVLDGLNEEVLTVDEWIADWRIDDEKFERTELKDGLYMYPSEFHDGKPDLQRRKRAHDIINDRKKLKSVPTHPFEEPAVEPGAMAVSPEVAPGNEAGGETP